MWLRARVTWIPARLDNTSKIITTYSFGFTELIYEVYWESLIFTRDETTSTLPVSSAIASAPLFPEFCFVTFDIAQVSPDAIYEQLSRHRAICGNKDLRLKPNQMIYGFNGKLITSAFSPQLIHCLLFQQGSRLAENGHYVWSQQLFAPKDHTSGKARQVHEEKAHGGAFAFCSYDATPIISLHYYSITADLCLAGWCDRKEAGTRTVSVRNGQRACIQTLHFPRLSWQRTEYSLVQLAWGSYPQPIFQCLSPPKPDFYKRRYMERSAMLPGQHSNTRACVSGMWWEILAYPMPPKFLSGNAGRHFSFLFFSQTRKCSSQFLQKTSSCADPKFFIGRVSTRVQHRAMSLRFSCPPGEIGVSYSVLLWMREFKYGWRFHVVGISLQ